MDHVRFSVYTKCKTNDSLFPSFTFFPFGLDKVKRHWRRSIPFAQPKLPLHKKKKKIFFYSIFSIFFFLAKFCVCIWYFFSDFPLAVKKERGGIYVVVIIFSTLATGTGDGRVDFQYIRLNSCVYLMNHPINDAMAWVAPFWKHECRWHNSLQAIMK